MFAGMFGWKGYSTGAHRFSYLLAYGPFDPALFVRHRCGVKPCVNPAHLTLGTRYENYRDEVVRNILHIQPGELFTYEQAPLLAPLRTDYI
jgi:hypothetical protein